MHAGGSRDKAVHPLHTIRYDTVNTPLTDVPIFFRSFQADQDAGDLRCGLIGAF